MLVPPVMGAVAFIIPEMIGGTYCDVCKAALIPGLLFYVSVRIHKNGMWRLSNPWGERYPVIRRVHSRRRGADQETEARKVQIGRPMRANWRYLRPCWRKRGFAAEVVLLNGKSRPRCISGSNA